MRVIVTRPEPEASRWVADLAGRGYDALALPLIAIAPASHPEAALAVQTAWQGLAQYNAVMFVSGNAVIHFFAVAPSQPVWPTAGPRCWAPGPGTQHALVQAGVAAACIDAPPADAGQFDSEALWQVVQGSVRSGQRVLVVRGSDAAGQGAGRDWMAQQLTAAGAQVDTVEAYERRAPQFTPQQVALARAAAVDGAVWLFSSSEAIGNLQSALQPANWSRARAVATHPRIAEAARTAGFGVVCASRPALAAVVASIESIQ
ncbi:MAG: uroporphyrinogen-III synthase [Pseudomonadota bacterium]